MGHHPKDFSFFSIGKKIEIGPEKIEKYVTMKFAQTVEKNIPFPTCQC